MQSTRTHALPATTCVIAVLLWLCGSACAASHSAARTEVASTAPAAQEPNRPEIVVASAAIESPAPPAAAANATASAAASAPPGASSEAPAPSGLPLARPLPPGAQGRSRCQLPAPKLSDDTCQSDADCAVEMPCHATACVAKAKAQHPSGRIMCTRELRCYTSDTNRCGCYQGKCALIPPGP